MEIEEIKVFGGIWSLFALLPFISRNQINAEV
jgi:hypothetical protein